MGKPVTPSGKPQHTVVRFLQLETNLMFWIRVKTWRAFNLIKSSKEGNGKAMANANYLINKEYKLLHFETFQYKPFSKQITQVRVQ